MKCYLLDMTALHTAATVTVTGEEMLYTHTKLLKNKLKYLKENPLVIR